MAPGDHLNENDSQRPNVGTVIDGFAENLFRSHVRKRAGGRNALRSAGAGHDAGEAEVYNFGRVIIGTDDVGRLNVAVDDVVRVGRAKPPGDLDGKVQRLGDGKRTARQLFRQRFPFVVSHYEEEFIVFRLFDAVNHADIRMIQSGSGSRFPEKNLFVARTDDQIRRREF